MSNNHIEHFLASLLLLLILPIMPIMAELVANSEVSNKDLLLAAAMYSITIGISSTSILQFAIGIFVSLFCSIVYAIGGESVNWYFPISGMLLIFIFHSIERYKIHIIQKKGLFNF